MCGVWRGRGGRLSPRPDRKKSGKKMSLDTSAAARLLHQPHLTLDNTTNFFLPSLDVKVSGSCLATSLSVHISDNLI